MAGLARCQSPLSPLEKQREIPKQTDAPLMPCLNYIIDLCQEPLPPSVSGLHEAKLQCAVQSTQITRRAVLIKKPFLSFYLSCNWDRNILGQALQPSGQIISRSLNLINSYMCRQIFKSNAWTEMPLLLLSPRFLYLDPDFLLLWGIETSTHLSQSQEPAVVLKI